MNRILSVAILVWLGTTCRAQAVGGLAEVTIIDRESGAVLTPHYYRGEYWVAGNPGARYAIEIHNKLGERVMAVTSVDGVNVVSGATAGWDQTGYVFTAGDRYQITGWRKSDAEIAAFTFTASPNSYAERTGRPANVGIIGVALFRERPPQPAYTSPSIGRFTEEDRSRYDSRLKDEAAESAPARQSMDKAAAAGAANSAAESDARLAAAAPAPMQPSSLARAPAPKLGTGHGAREYSYVNHTEFERMQTQPNEVIRIRYDSLDNLFAMGIIRRPRPVAPSLNPFPVSPDPQYVPDPRG
jgi:hypothetical protein